MLLIKLEEEKDMVTKSGLVVAASFKQDGLKKAEILDVGYGEPNALNGELITIPFKAGDVVMFQDRTWHDVEDEDGNKFGLLNYKQVLAKKE
jgi:co-chaperonin GroES (HSP10)